MCQQCENRGTTSNVKDGFINIENTKQYFTEEPLEVSVHLSDEPNTMGVWVELDSNNKTYRLT